MFTDGTAENSVERRFAEEAYSAYDDTVKIVRLYLRQWPETKKTAEKAVAAVEKTATAAKSRTKKKAGNEEGILEYRGMQVNVEALLADAKADWIANGHKEKDYVSCKLYLKPEDRRAYYVINDTDEGNVPC